MSGVDLNEDYAKKAQDAEDAIAKIAEMAQSGGHAPHDEDIAVDDNISINSKDLNALENSEMDEAEMERILNGDDCDEELNELVTDDSDGEIDIDDPRALEKLEAKANKSTAKKEEQKQKAPTATTAAPVAQQKKPAAAAAAEAPTATTTAPPKVTQPTAAASDAKAAPAAAAAAPKPVDKAAKAKSDAAEYAKLIKMVNDNIEQLKGFVTMYLKQKDQANASKYLPLVKQSQGYLAIIQQAQKDGEDVPSYEYGILAIQQEKKIAEIGQDDIRITAVNMVNVKSTAKYSLKFNLQIGKEQSQTTKQVKGKDVIEFNQPLTFTLAPSNIRASQNGLKLCKLARCTVELHSHGMLWGSSVVGTGDLKMSPLQTKCESIQTIKIKNDESAIMCELEVKLTLNRPFITPEYEETTINIVKLGSTHQAPEIKTVAPAQVTTPSAQQAAKPAQGGAKPAQGGAKPAPAAAPKEKDPDDMTSIEIMKASGFSKSVTVFETLGELPQFLGLDALNAEKDACIEMAKTKQFKRRMELFHCQQRASDCKMRVMTLEAQVGSGALDPQLYCDLLKGQVDTEAILIEETTKVAKWYHGNGKVDDAKYYAELVKWFKDRKVLAEKEHEQMLKILEGGDEDEEE